MDRGMGSDAYYLKVSSKAFLPVVEVGSKRRASITSGSTSYHRAPTKSIIRSSAFFTSRLYLSMSPLALGCSELIQRWEIP